MKFVPRALRAGLLGSVAVCALAAADETQSALARISADSMRGNLSFLASDVLEGRATPSKGLDVAAEFIASQFRKAGLEPIGPGGSYFQEARYLQVTPMTGDLSVTLLSDARELNLGSDAASVRSLKALDVKDAAVLVLPEKGELPEVRGKVVAGVSSVYGTEAALIRLQAAKPALIVLVSKRRGRPGAAYLEDADAANAPIVRLANEDAAIALSSGKGLILSVHAAAPETKEFVLRNVGGIVRGSDPELRNEFVMLTAHYDHVGTRTGAGDTIFNGANDNGSGTVSVLEIGSALAALPTHPKRSILFMALFGEERGLLGSFYYSRHPLVPLSKTVAAVNLEQMGRTDDKDGARIRSFSFTGASYSDLPAVMTEAAKAADVSVYKKSDGDAFFPRSDNYAFALEGVVSHTLVVAYEYSDYHGVGDEWEKIDYANMAVVDRAVAAGLIRLANRVQKPKWSEGKEAQPYREAAKQH